MKFKAYVILKNLLIVSALSLAALVFAKDPAAKAKVNRHPAREPKAARCLADAVLSASLIYKISDPYGYNSSASTVGNPVTTLIKMTDDEEQWVVAWKGGGYIEYNVIANPKDLEGDFYSCDIATVKKGAVR